MSPVSLLPTIVLKAVEALMKDQGEVALGLPAFLQRGNVGGFLAANHDDPSAAAREVEGDAVPDHHRLAIQPEAFERTKLLRRVRVADEQLFPVIVIDGHRDLSRVETGPDSVTVCIGDVVKLPDA
ncbi:MAG: hypothetical protein ACYTG0_22515 [Planctomycetota bacterium]